jgi:hypothetical protein
MPMSAQVKASIIVVAGQWALERARTLQDESSREPVTMTFDDLLKEHFNVYYDFLSKKFSQRQSTRLT